MKKKTKFQKFLSVKLLPTLIALFLSLSGCQSAPSEVPQDPTENTTEATATKTTETTETTEKKTETTETTETVEKKGYFLNGVSIEEFSLVFSDSDTDYSFRAAKYIQSQILERTGANLDLREDYMPAQTHEIVIGETNRQISEDLDADTQNMEFAIMANDEKIALEGDYFIIAAAAYFFVETYIPNTYFDNSIPKEAVIHQPIQKEAQNFIILIGDGMGFNQTRLFEAYDVTKTGDKAYSDGEDIFYGYYFPNQGQSRTDSLSGTTDSAAGGTALSTGYKTINRYIGKDSEGNDIQTLTELAGSLGKATAVMSTDEVTGATPASFSAHALDRNKSDTILASQAIIEETYGTYIRCNYNEYDQNGVKTLQNEISKTLTELDKDGDGFFMMYEEAHIDKHCHSNDMATTFETVVRFNQVIGIIMEYAFYNPDTFVLITADHETGGLQSNSDGTFAYTQTSHSSADVPVFAYGMNAEVFHGKTVENTQIPKTIAHMMGVENFGDADQYPSLLAK